ncbi:MAG: DUF2752 domain-containing protein [Bacteroidetes bacterium]|nr:DUF2752 domain-containing protein [Bacteroidota bacterium]
MCIVKHVTDIPCPSCGSTRSALCFLNGNITDSLKWNPLGLILVILMFLCPFLMAYDLLKRKKILYALYNQTELLFKHKWVAIPAVLLILSNWIWNICKGL